MTTSDKPRIGISACLMGQKVRHDGGYCSFSLLQDWSRSFLWMPVCPEMGMGLGTPRNPVRLVQDEAQMRMLDSKTGRDVTELMDGYLARFQKLWDDYDLDGFIVKKKSPSCGLERVTLYNPEGAKIGKTMGLFTAALKKHAPMLPIEEEGRLLDVGLREAFVERVFALRRWKMFRATERQPKELIDFHSRHKYQLLAHSRVGYSKLGRLVACAGNKPWPVVRELYEEEFLACFAQPQSVKRHSDVLYHLIGFFKKTLDPSDRAEMVALTEQFRNRQVPLSVPLTLLNHHVQKQGTAWMKMQTYLAPYPTAFNMRHHFFGKRGA